jgi:hypothetical protein
MYKIAVCIPCTINDINYLKECLYSIECQLRKPDIVVVSISSVESKDDLSIDIPAITFPIEFIYSSGTVYAGGNRNIAAKRALQRGADLISFFDADDIMHPRRLERIESIFIEHPNITGLLHNFITGPKRLYNRNMRIPWQPFSYEYLETPFLYYSDEGFNFLMFNEYFRKNEIEGYGFVQNAHITVKTSYWENNPYFEAPAPFGPCEDNHFSASIIKNGLILGYIPDILSNYVLFIIKKINKQGFYLEQNKKEFI